MNRNFLLHAVVFGAGLAVVGWVGAGYLGTNALAFGVTALIAAVYLAGALELWRDRQATAALAASLGTLSAPPDRLDGWLAQVPAGLRDAARQRIEGSRAGWPAPSMTPYFVGLLVLLGMLGTFLGMVATLRGTGIALDGATDVAAIRASLAAPVKGLGFAFGTSVAGVAASAMLGLASALSRRERIVAVRQLDVAAGTTLRAYSPAQRDETLLALLRRQAELAPALVERLQAVADAVVSQGEALGERLAAGQAAFQARSETAYAHLASTLAHSLSASVADSGRAAGDAIQPAVERTLAGLARETADWHERIGQRMQQQLDTVSARLAETTATLSDGWSAALAAHTQAGAAQAGMQRATMEAFADTFAQRSDRLVDAVAARLDGVASHVAGAWDDVLARQARTGEAQAADFRQALAAAADTFARQSSALVETLAEARAEADAAQAAREAAQREDWRERLDALAATQRAAWDAAGADAAQRQQAMLDAWSQSARAVATQVQEQSGRSLAEIGRLAAEAGEAPRLAASLVADLRQQAAAQAARDEAAADERRRVLDALAQRSSAVMDTVAVRLDGVADHVAQAWDGVLARQAEVGEAQAADFRQVLTAAADTFARQSSALVETLAESRARAESAFAAREAAQRDDWRERLDTLAATQRAAWEAAGADADRRQQAMLAALSQAAGEMATQAREQASRTLAEIGQLVDAASEAPRVAAGVVAELRQHVSDSMVRDNAMLDERNRMLETLATLLDAVDRAATRQRTAVDTLVTAAEAALAKAGDGFAERAEAEAGRMATVAAQVTGSAVEVASLGEVFGAAVQRFGESSLGLAEQLQRIEAALEASLARSDEQLAYYVAQAREVIDLSMLSQKQVIEALQQLAGRQDGEAGGA